MPGWSKTEDREVVRDRSRVRPQPHLFVALMAHAPQAPKVCVRVHPGLKLGRLSREDPVFAAHRCLNGPDGLLLPDAECSHSHAELRRIDGADHLVDLDSRHGTYVNGRKLVSGQPIPLRDRDVIELGRTFLVYREATTAVAEAYTKLGRSTDTVLLLGETGTGKEVVARHHHDLLALPSRLGRTGSFIARNCAAIPAGLFESELFGAEPGGADLVRRARPGWVKLAHRGTLFLDEIGDLDRGLQSRFLRILETRQIVPLGGKGEHVDFALVAATDADLDHLVQTGAFDDALLGRLLQIVIRLPALRDRREDLGLLVAALLRTIRRPDGEVGRADARLSVEAARALMLHHWPKNVRELKHVLLAALLECPEGGVITLDQLPTEYGPRAGGGVAADERGAAPARGKPVAGDVEERQRLIDALTLHGGNVTAVVAALGLKYRMDVYRLLWHHELDADDYRPKRRGAKPGG
jgi:DNA-binding NtrC family response regulator